MNNKAEYNRCALPRLRTKLGENDLEKWRVEDREEMIKEATIEEKIRIRKKEKAKRRAEKSKRMGKEQPKRKRMKMGTDLVETTRDEQGRDTDREQHEMEKTEAEIQLVTSPAKKRKEQRAEVKPSKKKRGNHDIMRYIICKKKRG